MTDNSIKNKFPVNIKNSIKKILIIKLRGIGDVVLSTIVFDNLRKDFPNAKLDFLTDPPSVPALSVLPFLNEVIKFDRKSILKKVGLVYEIRKRKYDLVFDFFSNPTTAQLTFFSGAKFKAGFPYKGRKYAYNLYGVKERAKYHAAQLHLEFLNKIGLSHDENKLYFGINSDDEIFAEIYFSENKLTDNFVVGISPSGGWSSKRCEPEKFAEIADSIVEKYGAKILIVGGPGDEKDADLIKRTMRNDALIAHRTTLRQMAALITHLNVLISNDSGPMHISTAVGTPVLSLHGPTNPYLQGPFGNGNVWVRFDELDCIECNLLECPRNHECFRELSVDKVLKKFESVLKTNKIEPNAYEKH